MARTKKNNQEMRVFKKLPESLPERIAALTPKELKGLTTKVSLLSSNSCLLDLPEEKSNSGINRACYANMLCKVTNKTRSLLFSLRSGSLITEPVFKEMEIKGEMPPKIQKALDSGWTKSDISYEAIINGVLIPSLNKEEVDGVYCPESIFSNTNLVIVVSDYNKEQFIGWFFYNENLDEVLNYTNYKV